MKNKKYKVNTLMPEHLLRKIQDHMYKEGYNLRKKSLWVSESLSRLLELKKENYTHLVNAATEIQKKTKAMTIYVEKDLYKKLDDAISTVRKHYPKLEGVKSLIIRASVVKRLFDYDNKNGT
jgi:hypothetical protein